jgi:hypothetical protein
VRSSQTGFALARSSIKAGIPRVGRLSTGGGGADGLLRRSSVGDRFWLERETQMARRPPDSRTRSISVARRVSGRLRLAFLDFSEITLRYPNRAPGRGSRWTFSQERVSASASPRAICIKPRWGCPMILCCIVASKEWVGTSRTFGNRGFRLPSCAQQTRRFWSSGNSSSCACVSLFPRARTTLGPSID